MILVQRVTKGDTRCNVFSGEWNGGEYRFDVQVLHKVGESFYYAGNGKYCRDADEVNSYIAGVLA